MKIFPYEFSTEFGSLQYQGHVLGPTPGELVCSYRGGGGRIELGLESELQCLFFHGTNTSVTCGDAIVPRS